MFLKNKHFLNLINRELSNRSFSKINIYKYLFSFIKKFNNFKLIATIRRRFRGDSKKNKLFRLKLNYNIKTRVKFINKIRYRDLLISISRFNILRFLINKNNNFLNKIGKYEYLSKRFLFDRYSQYHKFIKKLKITNISSNIFNFFLNFQLFVIKIEKLKLSEFGFCVYNNNIFKRNRLNIFKNNLDNFWFKFLNYFYNLNVFNFYFNFLIKKVFIPRDHLRFEQIQFKRRISVKRRKQKLNIFCNNDNKRYLNGLLLNKYSSFFFHLFANGFSFFSFKQQILFKFFWTFSLNWSRAIFFWKSKFNNFLSAYKFIHYFKYKRFYIHRIKRLIKRKVLQRRKYFFINKLKWFINKFNFNKRKYFLLQNLNKKIFIKQKYFFNLNFILKNKKYLFSSNVTINKYFLKYFKKINTKIFIKKILNINFFNKNYNLKFNSNLKNKYLFNIIFNDMRLVRFLTVLNGIDSKLLIISTPSQLFPHWKILTKRYIRILTTFKRNKLYLNHLRFISNYYKFYNFSLFLAPLIDQAYYSLINLKYSKIINLKDTELNNNSITPNSNIEHHFSDNYHISNYINHITAKFKSNKINKTPSVEFILKESEPLKLLHLNFKNSKIFNLRLISLLLSILISSGKKKKALYIFNSLFGLMKFKYQFNYLNEYTKFLISLKPILRYRSMYIGGKKYKIPLLLTPDRGYSLATRWYVNNSINNSSSSIIELFENFSKTLNNQGNLLKIRRDYHLLSFENKSYTRFLRFFKQGF